jgi:hypothetical protein
VKINIDRNVVEFLPESVGETASLEALWRVIVECLRENKKLVPIGEYVPIKENLARFVIEGVPGGKTEPSEEVAEKDCTVYCALCNKYKHVAGGEAISYCCGRVMEVVD